MAGRIVVLQFDDKRSYEMFLAENGPYGVAKGWGTLVGTYLLPSKTGYCQCEKRRNVANWRPHRKYKIPVCVKCGRPSTYWYHGIKTRLEVALGKNLDELDSVK